ncbi:trypsin, alkaline A-like [Anticarsia gemmatalis]|uniref:trypsin, alkaline A-like n=1 Tax=Anticarsia gemmatalis TaxID=129554 RepID=UPI003F768254
MWKCVAVFAILCLVHVHSELYFDRVIQGSPTIISKYPVLAQLLLDAWGTQEYVQHCAGIILTSRHVLSAAHCFQYNSNTRRNYTQPKYWKIRVGSSYRTRGGAMHNLKTIIPHNEFDKYYYTNDIAIVVVSKQFTFNNNVKQSTIIKQGVEIKPDSLCQLVGWGVLEPDGPQPEQLQDTTLRTIDHKICKYRYSTIGAVIQDSMMCAGLLDMAGPDGCFGDSGGPLIYKGLVVGLVSFGYSCGHRYFPGVYTKISHYTSWVVNTVNNNK